MAFSEALAERIRQRLARRKNIEEKKMFGGVGLLLLLVSHFRRGHRRQLRQRGYWLFAWRNKGDSARVKRTTASPVTVLRS